MWSPPSRIPGSTPEALAVKSAIAQTIKIHGSVAKNINLSVKKSTSWKSRPIMNFCVALLAPQLPAPKFEILERPLRSWFLVLNIFVFSVYHLVLLPNVFLSLKKRKNWGGKNVTQLFIGKFFILSVGFLLMYTQWTEKVSPKFLSPLDPTVNVSCKNCCVCSPGKIFHPNAALICYSWHN